MIQKVDKKMLLTIKDIYEEKENIKILSLYQHNNDIVGIYINPSSSYLSFLNKYKYSIDQQVDNDLNINLFELGQVLYMIYRYGSLRMLYILLQSSDIVIENIGYDYILDFVKTNIPLGLASAKFIEAANSILEEDEANSYDILLKMVNDFLCFYSVDIKFVEEINTKNDEIKFKNQLQKFFQILREVPLSPISEKKIYELDMLYKDLHSDF